MSTARDVHEWAEEAPAPAPAPFFIVGSGRSGTTLLRMMLCSHSRISIPPETWYLLPLLQRFRIDRPLDAAEIQSAVSIIAGHCDRADMKLDLEELRRELIQLREASLRDLTQIVYRRYMQLEGKVHWGDKTPVYIEILPELARMFPDSRFIFLIRDGRDVAKSFQARRWMGRWLHNNTREWTRALEYYQCWIDQELRERILEVRYEDLVLETEATLRRICRFIGEEFQPQMLAWERTADTQILPEELSGVHRKLKLRIGGNEAVARWKREMSARETFVAEAFMGADLKRLGYERRYRSPLWAPAFVLTRLYCWTVLSGGTTLLKALMKIARIPRKDLANADSSRGFAERTGRRSRRRNGTK
jgi:Sulfotransferase family